MGWADCGTDSRGRRIGYAFSARCDEPGCYRRIDRGLSYVCGDMHGEDEVSCEKYFCSNHKRNFVEASDGQTIQVCNSCRIALLTSGYWYEDEDDGVLKEKKDGRESGIQQTEKRNSGTKRKLDKAVRSTGTIDKTGTG